MSARFDHLVVAVADLDAALVRWRTAGLPATRGGMHPVGTENVLVRGPRPAYVELIAAGSEESNPWLDRVRSACGPISWAVAVDDIEVSRATLVEAGFTPSPVVDGSRRTPDGGVVEWRLCDLGAGPYDGALPFLIQWTRPMEPGPADGPVITHVTLTSPDPDRVADLLVGVGFVPSPHWPRRLLHQVDGAVTITLHPVSASASASVQVSVSFDVASGEPGAHMLDGVAVSTHPDRRRFAAAVLLPAVDEAFERLRGELADWPNPHPGGAPAAEEEYSRVLNPAKYRLLGVRADAWVEVVVAAGLGVAEERDPATVRWAGESALDPSTVTVLAGRPGTVPIVVGLRAQKTFVQVGVGNPVEILDRQPDCGCDACDTGSADLLETLDSAFILALSGGVYAVRASRTQVVRRSLDGWGSSNLDHDEAELWLAEAAAGRRTSGVVRGEPWL